VMYEYETVCTAQENNDACTNVMDGGALSHRIVENSLTKREDNGT
jgi:hypothetical protein